MDILLVSHVLLWVALIVMAVLLFALTRQVGILHERVAPAGALAVNQKLKVGQDAPAMSLQTLDAKLVEVGMFGGTGQSQKSQLIFWISPDCPVCKTLLPALKSAAKAESGWIDLILASDGADLDHSGYVSQHGLESWHYVVSELLGKPTVLQSSPTLSWWTRPARSPRWALSTPASISKACLKPRSARWRPFRIT